MNKEIYTILGVGIALATIMLSSQAALRADMRSEHTELRSAITELRSDMREDFAAVRSEMADLRTEMGELTERVIRVEVMHTTSPAEQDAVEQ